MRAASSSQNGPSPTADLMPTGRPVSAAMVSTSSSSPSTSRNAEWPAGLLQSTPTGNAADRGDFGGDLGAGQHAAQTGLGSLAELDLDGPDRRGGRHPVDQTGKAECAVVIAATEIAGADLPDQVAAVEVVRRHSALAGGVQGAGHGRALVERGDGRAADSDPKLIPETLTNDSGPESLGPAPRTAEHLCRRQRHGRVGVAQARRRGPARGTPRA